MKFLKPSVGFLCGLLFACILIHLAIYLAYSGTKNQKYETPTIILNVGTGDRSVNQMPTLETISLSFPEFGVNNKDFMDYFTACSRTGPLTVKVTAINPRDPDGNLSRMRFYYYNVGEPDNSLEYRETWSISPYVYFIIPKIGGEYRFGVILYDNNGGIVDSKDIIGQPSIYFPNPCE